MSLPRTIDRRFDGEERGPGRRGLEPARSPHVPSEAASGPDDLMLLRAAYEGSGPAFDLLVARHGPAIVGFARHLTADRATAEDAAQEAFVRLLRGGEAAVGEAGVRVWLLAVVRNLALDEARRRSVRRRFLDLVRGGRDPRRGGGARREPTPPEALAAAELGGAIARALGTLPEAQRSAFLLRERDGLDYAQIAQVLGCPVKTVSTRLLRARRALQRQLDEHLDGGSTS